MTGLHGYNGSSYVPLDVPDTAVELSFQVSSLRKPNAKSAPFSLTFDLPFSQTNKSFFGYVDQVSVGASDFDITKKTSARLFDDNLPIMQGVLQITSIDLLRRMFRCRFFSETASLFDAVRGKKWADVWRDSNGNIFCPLDHPNTATNIRNTWSGTQPDPLLPSGTIIYALTDAGISANSVDGTPAQYYGNWDDAVPTENLRPCVRVSYLLDEVFQFAGFSRNTAECFFSDTAYRSQNLYVMTGMDEQLLPKRLSFQWRVRLFSSTPGAPVPISCGTASAYGTPPEVMVWEAPPNGTGYYDPDNEINPAGWFPSVEQVANVRYSITTSAYTGTIPPNFHIQVVAIVVDGANIVLASTTFEYEDGLTSPFVWEPQVQVQASQNVLTYIQCTGDNGVTREVSLQIDWALVSYVSVGGSDDNIQVDMSAALGDDTLDKWIQGLCDTYNLMLVVEERTKEVYFVTYDSWRDQVPALDWTHKIDFDGPQELLPATEYQAKSIMLTPSEGEDAKNRYYQNRFGVRKGQFRYQSRNDFATEEQVIGDFFTLLRVGQLTGYWLTNGQPSPSFAPAPIIITQLISSVRGTQAEFTGQKNALCYYQGNQSFADTPITIGATSVTSAALFTAYNGDAADSDVFSLEYALSNPDLVDTSVIGSPESGLYQKFWYNYLQELYSQDARVLRCSAKLNALDIANLDLSRYVRIQNSEYRIISIQNYNVGSSGLSNLTLFKKADGFLFDCGLTPSVASDGRITWTDGEGVVQSPTQICCVSYGFTWNPGINTCRAYEDRGQSTAERQNNIYQSGTSPFPASPSSAPGISLTGEATRHFLGLNQSLVIESWEMSAQTLGNTVGAEGSTGQRMFFVSPNLVVTLSVQWLAVVTRGGQQGEASSGTEEILLTTTSSSTTKGTGSIYSRGLTGFGVEVDVTDNVGGSQFLVECTSPSGKDADWFLQIRATYYDTNALNALPQDNYSQFQDADYILWQNNDSMIWNV